MDPLAQEDFLVLCLAEGMDPRRAARHAPATDSQWSALLDRAQRNSVAPLLHRRLSRLPPEVSVPPEIRRQLKQILLRTAACNLRLFAELAELLRLFRAREIPAIVLKGAHLAETVYGDAALRPMVDVDLLLRQQDAVRVGGLLQERGFAVLMNDDHHTAYTGNGGHLVLEAHWNLTSPGFPFRVDTDAIRRRRQTARIAGEQAEVLCPEDLLLHLCLHASYHHLFDYPLKHLCDIAATARHFSETLDWGAVRGRARDQGIARCVYLTLWMARETLDAPIPPDVLEDLTPGNLDPAWPRLALHRALYAEDAGPGALSSIHLGRLWSAKGLGTRASILAGCLFPSRDALARMYALPHGSRKLFLYYPVRLMDLLFRHRGSAWRLLTRDRFTMARVGQENVLRDWLTLP